MLLLWQKTEKQGREDFVAFNWRPIFLTQNILIEIFGKVQI